MAIAVVAHTGKGSSDGGNTVTTDAIDTTGATLIVVVTSKYTGGTPTFSDSKSNTWSALTNYGGSGKCRIYYCASPTVGSGHTFTFNTGGGLGPAIFPIAFSGTAASPYDAENGATGLNTGSVTPAEDNEVLVAGFSCYPGGSATIDSSFTITDQVAYVTGQTMAGGAAYQIQTTATARNPTWSTSVSETAGSALAAFKAGTGGGNITFNASWCKNTNVVQSIGRGF